MLRPAEASCEKVKEQRQEIARGNRASRKRRLRFVPSQRHKFYEHSICFRGAAAPRLREHRSRNASLDSLKARKRIGPRVNEVLTINDGSRGCTSFWPVHADYARHVATTVVSYYSYCCVKRARRKVALLFANRESHELVIHAHVGRCIYLRKARERVPGIYRKSRTTEMGERERERERYDTDAISELGRLINYANKLY